MEFAGSFQAGAAGILVGNFLLVLIIKGRLQGKKGHSSAQSDVNDSGYDVFHTQLPDLVEFSRFSEMPARLTSGSRLFPADRDYDICLFIG